MKKCPYCAEEIQNDAKKCRFCGEWLKSEKKDIGKKSFISRNMRIINIVVPLIFIVAYIISFNNIHSSDLGCESFIGCIQNHPNFWSGIFGVLIGICGIILYLINWTTKNKGNVLFRKKWSTRVRLVILVIIWLGLFATFYSEMLDNQTNQITIKNTIQKPVTVTKSTTSSKKDNPIICDTKDILSCSQALSTCPDKCNDNKEVYDARNVMCQISFGEGGYTKRVNGGYTCLCKKGYELTEGSKGRGCNKL